MKTTVAKKTDLTRKWYILDAKDKTLGHISTKIADTLRGKNKAIFTPNVDCGDFVIVINAEKVRLTGNKLDKKMYYTHSGYPGALTTRPAKELLNTKPTKVIELSVRGMLPRNRLRKDFMKKLKLFVGETHPHQAQNPEPLEI